MDNVEIASSAQQMINNFSQRMEYFEGELRKGLDQAQAPSLTSLAAEFASFKAFTLSALRSIQDQIELTTRSIDQLEMRSRRKILLIHGVPEEEKEETASVVVQAVTSRLKMAQFSSVDISRCHRMGRASTTKPRPILFKLRDVAVRDKIWLSKTNLKGSSFALSEFLTKSRHEVFMAARQRFGITKCWTSEGNVFVIGPAGNRLRINWMSDLNKIAEPSQVEAPAAAASPRLPAASQKLPAVTKEAAEPRAKRTVKTARK